MFLFFRARSRLRYRKLFSHVHRQQSSRTTAFNQLTLFNSKTSSHNIRSSRLMFLCKSSRTSRHRPLAFPFAHQSYNFKDKRRACSRQIFKSKAPMANSKYSTWIRLQHSSISCNTYRRRTKSQMLRRCKRSSMWFNRNSRSKVFYSREQMVSNSLRCRAIQRLWFHRRTWSNRISSKLCSMLRQRSL